MTLMTLFNRMNVLHALPCSGRNIFILSWIRSSLIESADYALRIWQWYTNKETLDTRAD